MDLVSKQTTSLHAFCSLPPAHPPLPNCTMGHPLPSVLVPLCPPRWQGGMVERCGRCRLRGMREPPSVSAGPTVGPHAHGCPCAGVHPQASRGVLWLLRHLAWLPAPPLCVPHRRKLTPHSSFRQKQPLVFPPPLHSIQLLLSASPRELVCPFHSRPLLALLSHMAWDAAGLSGHWYQVCNFVLPLPAAAWGPSCCPVHRPCAQPPSPPW